MSDGCITFWFIFLYVLGAISTWAWWKKNNFWRRGDEPPINRLGWILLAYLDLVFWWIAPLVYFVEGFFKWFMVKE